MAHAGESHAGDAAGSEWRPTATPIHNASGFFMPSLDALDEVFAGTREGYFYTRDGNPTVRAFEEAVAALESAPLVGAFGSGHGGDLRRAAGARPPALATRSWRPRTCTA